MYQNLIQSNENHAYAGSDFDFRYSSFQDQSVRFTDSHVRCRLLNFRSIQNSSPSLELEYNMPELNVSVFLMKCLRVRPTLIYVTGPTTRNISRG